VKTAFNILTFLFISISQIETSRFRLRKELDLTLSSEFVKSIKRHGVIQPLFVLNDKGIYQLISGFRRIQAAKEIGLDKVPCLVVEGKIAKLAGFIENEHHEKPNIIDRADGIKMLFDDFGGTQTEFSELLGLTTSTLSDELSICRLDEAIKSAERNDPTLPKRELIPLVRIKDREERLSRYNLMKLEKAKNKGKRKKTVKPPMTKLEKAKALVSKIKALSAEIIRSYRDIEESKDKAACDNALIDLNSLILKIVPGMNDKYETRFIALAIENIADTIISAESKINDPIEWANIRESLKALHRALKNTNYKKSDASDFMKKVIQLLI